MQEQTQKVSNTSNQHISLKYGTYTDYIKISGVLGALGELENNFSMYEETLITMRVCA